MEDDRFTEYLYSQYKSFRKEVPSMLKAHKFIDDLINFLFPIKADKECVIPQIKLNLLQLQIDFKALIKPLTSVLEESPDVLTEKFFSKIPNIYRNLIKDVDSFLKFDPAAKSMEGIILYYPGFYSIAVYRLAHELYQLKIPFLARMISEYAHSKTGIDIHPGATIGETFFIDHGTGVVIGETSVIGN
ncbi:MAG: serine O-acetyltransferase, partial [Bacteroidota bacterium]